MGGSRKKVTVGYKYYLGIHMALPVIERLLRIRVGGKEAWIGNREGGRITINQPGLFGGESREGGIAGALDFLIGRPNQQPNDYLRSQLQGPLPAFRGVSSIILRQMYVGMNPYLKTWEYRGQRIHETVGGEPQWYGDKAEIVVDSPFRTPQLFYFVLDQSGSMGESVGDGLTRMDVMKQNMHKALDEIDRLRIDSGVDVSIGMAAFSSSSTSTSRTNVNSSDIAALKSWVSGLSPGGGTNFAAGISPAVTWFNNRPLTPDWRRACFFITDGEPNPQSSAAEAVTIASDLLNRSSGQFNDSDGTGVEMYGMNIDLSETRWTKMLDNTPRDGVPVISGGDQNALWNAIYFATMGPSSAMNPAHIIRECITDPDWGMGHPPADLDDASFRQCADTLHAENLGLSILWDRQQPIEDFVQLILNHIDGHTYIDPVTGLWTMRLVRDDYDAETLLALDPTNISRIDDATWPAFGERVNSVTVQYWDIHSGTDDSITVQDIALSQMQGTDINTTLQYPGITTGELASRIAARDLRSLSSPLFSCTIYANRAAEGLRLGSVFRLSWPDYGVADMIMRVVEVAFGSAQNQGVRIKAVQDVFSMPAASFTAPAPIEWEAPNTTPEPVPAQVAIELPYYALVQTVGEQQANQALASNPELGLLGVAAAPPAGLAINAQLYVDSGAGWEESGYLDFCPYARSTAQIDYLDSVIPITDGRHLSNIEPGAIAQINDELIVIDAVTATEFTVRRGILDTVPAKHPEGSTIIVWDTYLETDEVEYVLGDQVSARVLPSTSTGQLPLDAAQTSTVNMNQRALRPYPPGQVKINGEYFPESTGGNITLTWSHRNRLQQTTADLLDFLSDGVTPEPGTIYSIEVLGPDQSVLYTVTDIDDTEHTIPAEAISASFITLRIWPVRDGLKGAVVEHALSTLAPPINLVVVQT